MPPTRLRPSIHPFTIYLRDASLLCPCVANSCPCGIHCHGATNAAGILIG